MRPEARVAAAIDILETWLAGTPVEKGLTSWARAHRFAGSGDRAAIRDLVFDALRRRRSLAWLGGAETGRGLMLGATRRAGDAADTVFTGQGHAPAVLREGEAQKGQPLETAPRPVALDCPDWLWPILEAAHGDQVEPILTALQERAPIFLRTNTAKTTREAARAALAEEDIPSEPHGLAETALLVTGNARRVRQSRAFQDGLVELQDAASQAVVAEALDHLSGDRVLDYCAGGGGKALAFAAARALNVVAHDVSPARMKDIPVRAARAGTPVDVVTTVAGDFDLVLCDAPCSGSGAWRRQPEGKWTLDAPRLQTLTKVQDDILETARAHVHAGGVLAYATCSILPAENTDRVAAFLDRHPAWHARLQRQWTPLDGGDGFFLAVLAKN